MCSYLEKYEVLQNENITVKDLMILRELTYEPARKEMTDIITAIREHNEEHPNSKYYASSIKPHKVPKVFLLKHYGINENYIFKKAKEEMVLKNLKEKESKSISEEIQKKISNAGTLDIKS